MINKLSNVAKHSEPWDAAIADASKQIKALKRAVKVYKKHRDAGDEWPGFKRTVGTAKTVPGRAKAAATDSRDTAGMRGIL